MIPLESVIRNCSRSLRKIVNRSGERISPWHTPILHGKKSDNSLLLWIQDFATLYMFIITVKPLPLMPVVKSFCHSEHLSTNVKDVVCFKSCILWLNKILEILLIWTVARCWADLLLKFVLRGHCKHLKVSHHFNIVDGPVNSGVNCLHEIKLPEVRNMDEEIRQL